MKKGYIYFCSSLLIISILIIGYSVHLGNSEKYNASGDAYDYLQLGISLSKTGEFNLLQVSRAEIMEDFRSGTVGEKTYPSRPTAFRPPVWPFLIAGIFYVFGYNLIYILILKTLLHLLGCYLFYKTLKILDLRNVLMMVGIFLYSVSPAWQVYSRTFLSEPITLFFISFWIYLLIKFLNGNSPFWKQALTAGILILCHPYYLFLPFATWGMLWLFKKLKFSQLIMSGLLCFAVISVWIIRNTIVFDTPHLVLTTSSGAVMAKGWNEKVPEEHTNTKGDLADEELVLQDYDYDSTTKPNEVERMKLYQNASIHFIKNNPDKIFPILIKKLKSAFNPFPETPRSGFLETGRVIFHILSLLTIIFLLFFSNNKIIKALVLGLIFSTICITIFTYSGFRFRVPQLILELLFITYALHNIMKRIFLK